jgi:hypothetical protein
MTTKIRFTEPQIALVMRAYPNCNLDCLSEISFEFDQAGKIFGCFGTIKDGGNIDHDYVGSGLARLYETARRQLAARKTSVTILQFPNGQMVTPKPILRKTPRPAAPATERPILTTPITLSGGTFSALPMLLSFAFLPSRLLAST